MSQHPPEDEASSRIGSQLNAKWRIDSVLGVGGMATVYAATHRNGSRAALKVLHAEFARDASIRDRFLREGRIANRIEHPSAVQVMDDDTSDQGEAFIVMELLDGETLEDHVKNAGGKIGIEDTFRVLDPVLDLLGKLHEAEVVHRDIKPANIFLTRAGAVKVLDFGIARFREQKGGPEATRQGTALGTPQFMAPEQALGLGDLVDGRADLFSVGACMYSCLTGARLHEARAESEAFVLAATKAAPSIANLAPELPAEIVAFVDKALAYERANRFPDAAAMRTEMRALVAALRAGRLTASTAKKAAGVVVRGSEMTEEDAPASTEAKAEVIKRMKNIWKLLGMFMAGVRQYGWNHPESARHLQVAFEETALALSTFPDGVRWEVTPYSFSYDGAPVWEPDRPPFDRLPFQLFGDGLRKLQLRPGVTEQELRDLVAILMADPASGIGVDGDSVTGFWDRHFDHVAYMAIDSFSEGDADDREAFDKQCGEVVGAAVELAHIDKDSIAESLEAQAMQINLANTMREAAEAASALALDVATRATLGAQLSLSTDRWTERYVDAFAQAWLETSRGGDTALVADALREWAGDQVQLHNYTLGFAMFSAIATVLAQTDPKNAAAHEVAIANAMFPTETLRLILTHLAEQARGQDGRAASAIESAVATGVERTLGLLASDTLVPTACELVDACTGTPLGPVLLAYLKRWAKGHERDLAQKLATVRPETACELVRTLAEVGSPLAIKALESAFRSPHVEVRIEALMRLPGASSDKLGEELQKLLDDTAAPVRQEALRVITKLKFKAVGPALVRAIQAPAFHTHPVQERRMWLETLAVLNPARAESLAIELLAGWKMVPNTEREQSRVAAADMLARFGSKDALEAASSAAKKRWWNTQPVRDAAERAVTAISERLGLAPPKASPGPEHEA